MFWCNILSGEISVHGTPARCENFPVFEMWPIVCIQFYWFSYGSRLLYDVIRNAEVEYIVSSAASSKLFATRCVFVGSLRAMMMMVKKKKQIVDECLFHKIKTSVTIVNRPYVNVCIYQNVGFWLAFQALLAGSHNKETIYSGRD